ncbi:MAG: hypothetical protein V1872_11040 [bacterium]
MIEQHMGGYDMKDANEFFRICDKIPEVILFRHLSKINTILIRREDKNFAGESYYETFCKFF